MPTTSETRAREVIDAQLVAAGWVVQDRAALAFLGENRVAERLYEKSFADVVDAP